MICPNKSCNKIGNFRYEPTPENEILFRCLHCLQTGLLKVLVICTVLEKADGLERDLKTFCNQLKDGEL